MTAVRDPQWTRRGTCRRCGKKRTIAGHDPCLGTLPGVKFACCGHGHKTGGYIVFDNNTAVYFRTTRILREGWWRSPVTDAYQRPKRAR